MPDLTIERAVPSHLDDAYAIAAEYYDAVDVLEREDVEAFSRAYFDEASGFWLARLDGAVVGCIGLRPLSSIARSGEVKRLYVQPASRGQGIADKLLDKLHSHAEGLGYNWLYLDSKDDLQAAIRFYERRGYERCQRYNNNRQATVFMRRRMAADAPGT